jgi:DNA-binding CsgD family transcriptional regulator
MPIRYLNEDADGNIWFCTGKKLGAIRYQENKSPEIIFFPEINGQILSGFENVYPFDKENVFVASEKGIIHINLEKYKSRKKALGLVLGEIRGTGITDSLLFGGLLQDNMGASSNLHLPNSFRSFHFEFSSPSYETQENIEYSIYLEGSDNQWSAWSSRPEKEYTNLTNGRYRFRVKARDNLGNESESGIFEFEVDPPWYKTIWAYLFYLLAIGLLLRQAYQLQKRKLLIQQKKYEEKQEQLKILHQLELEKNEKEIIRLQNEQLINEMMFKNKELAETGMHLVERSDALIKVKEELQKLYRNTKENHDIKKTLQMLNDIEKNNANWEKFATHFDEINDNFLKNLKIRYPGLTNNDLKLCTYLQLNLASKEIAQMMNISTRGIEISRYRLRKKLGIPSETTLNEFFERFRDRGNP